MVAARAALRVLPVLWIDEASNAEIDAGLLLSAFRATAIAWAAAKFPEDASTFVEAAHAAAATFVTDNAIFNSGFKPAYDSAANAILTVSTLESLPYAAEAAESSFVAAASVEAIKSDMQMVEAELGARVLAARKLWKGRRPRKIANLWTSMKKALLARDEGWEVWTNWYEARLAGKPSIASFEIACAMIPDEIWQQGPKAVNAEIKRLIEEYKSVAPSQTPQPGNQAVPQSSIGLGNGTLGGSTLGGMTLAAMTLAAGPDIRPPQTSDEAAAANGSRVSSRVPSSRPAALEPFWKDGRLILPTNRLASDVDSETIAAALKSLCDELTELAEDAKGDLNIDRRLIGYLRRVAKLAATDAPTQDQLFRLAHAKDVLGGYADVVNREWPDFLAQRFHKLVLHFDRCVRQFSKWREFVRNAEQEPLSAEQLAAVPHLATAVAEALKDDDASQFVDPVLPDALQSLLSSLTQAATGSETLDPIEAGNALLAEDIVESINNILKRVVEVALAYKIGIEPTLKGIKATAKEAMEAFRDEAHKSIVEEARRLGKKVGPAITKWVKRILYGGPALYGSTALIHHLLPVFPSAFQWLELIKSFF